MPWQCCHPNRYKLCQPILLFYLVSFIVLVRPVDVLWTGVPPPRRLPPLILQCPAPPRSAGTDFRDNYLVIWTFLVGARCACLACCAAARYVTTHTYTCLKGTDSVYTPASSQARRFAYFPVTSCYQWRVNLKRDADPGKERAGSGIVEST